jgi:hypothetical protein
MKARMRSTGIHPLAHTQLPDPAQSLKIWMLHHIKHQRTWDGKKSVQRIIDDFRFIA